MSNPIRFFNNESIEIKRLSYTGTPKKSVYGTVATVRGFLRPLSETQASDNGFQFGQAFSLLVDVDSDLRKGDDVVIDSLTYKVEGVATHNRLSIPHRRALMTLPQAK